MLSLSMVLLIVICLFLYVSRQTGFTFANSQLSSLLNAGTAGQVSARTSGRLNSPATGRVTSQAYGWVADHAYSQISDQASGQVTHQVYTPDQQLAIAVRNFAGSRVQSLRIFSQSTADPAYNTPEKLLQYPAGAWEFRFTLDKTLNTFSYYEAMDGEELSLLKKSGKLYCDEGKGWRRVKAGQLREEPYSFAGVKSLEQLPFLFLDTKKPAGTLTRQEDVGDTKCSVFRLAPTLPPKGSKAAATTEPPSEIILWVTAIGQPRLLAARYFWISNPPGGTMFTVSQVNFL